MPSFPVVLGDDLLLKVDGPCLLSSVRECERHRRSSMVEARDPHDELLARSEGALLFVAGSRS